jgi:hypothetical protein
MVSEILSPGDLSLRLKSASVRDGAIRTALFGKGCKDYAPTNSFFSLGSYSTM